jgi:putative ABC transport system permease protein
VTNVWTLLQGAKMIKPLSVCKYYFNNQKQVALVWVIVSLSVFLQYALLIYKMTMLEMAQSLLPFNSNVYVYTQQSKQAQLKQLLRKQAAISEVLSFKLAVTSSPIGNAAYIVLLHAKDIKPGISSLQLIMIKGRLPAPGTHEVVLHWRVAAHKGLKIGDHFGSAYSRSDFLDGDYKLVGLLDGDLTVGFTDLDTYIHDYHLSSEDTSFLVIPKKGQLAKVDSFLRQCARKDPKLYTFHENNISTDITLDVIYFVITCIVTICISFLFYIYYYQRRSEYCLLEALGYNRRMIIGKVFSEMSGISLAGAITGGAVCFLCGLALNHSVFIERGLPLELWNMSYPLRLFSTPLAITLSSLVIVHYMFKKADLISIMEGEG